MFRAMLEEEWHLGCSMSRLKSGWLFGGTLNVLCMCVGLGPSAPGRCWAVGHNEREQSSSFPCSFPENWNQAGRGCKEGIIMSRSYPPLSSPLSQTGEHPIASQ